MRGQGRMFQRGPKWWIAYYVNGAEHRESAGDSEDDARRLLLKRWKEIHGGRFVGPQHERTTVNQLLDAYEADLVRRKKKSISRIKSALKPIRETFGEDRAVSLTAVRIAEWIDAMQAGGRADGSAKVHASYLRAALHLAERQERIARVPAFPTIEVSNTRQGFFEREQFDAIVGQLKPHYADVATFGYLTGWRKGEIVGLTWAMVDRAHGEIRLVDSKSGEGRLLTLRDEDGVLTELGQLIERRWAARVVGDRIIPLVFHRKGWPITHLNRAWDAAAKAAGLEGKLFHDFRRTAARDLVAAGNDYGTAMSITGHKTFSVFRRYQIVDARLMRRGLSRLQAYRQAAPAKVVALKADSSRTIEGAR